MALGLRGTKVRYEIANAEEGFLVARTARAATQALHRILERQKALGHGVRPCVGIDGSLEYLVLNSVQEPIARYWLDSGSAAPEPATAESRNA